MTRHPRIPRPQPVARPAMRELCALAERRRLDVLLSVSAEVFGTKGTEYRALAMLAVTPHATPKALAETHVPAGDIDRAARSLLAILRRDLKEAA